MVTDFGVDAALKDVEDTMEFNKRNLLSQENIDRMTNFALVTFKVMTGGKKALPIDKVMDLLLSASVNGFRLGYNCAMEKEEKDE